jgi:hypothetical protein
LKLARSSDDWDTSVRNPGRGNTEAIDPRAADESIPPDFGWPTDQRERFRASIDAGSLPE